MSRGGWEIRMCSCGNPIGRNSMGETQWCLYQEWAIGDHDILPEKPEELKTHDPNASLETQITRLFTMKRVYHPKHHQAQVSAAFPLASSGPSIVSGAKNIPSAKPNSSTSFPGFGLRNRTGAPTSSAGAANFMAQNTRLKFGGWGCTKNVCFKKKRIRKGKQRNHHSIFSVEWAPSSPYNWGTGGGWS